MGNLTDVEGCIRPIFHRHSLSPASSITPLSGGGVNPIYLVDDQYIIRFNLRDKATSKFQREANCYRLLAGVVPTPHLYLYDNSRSTVDCEYMILQRLQGENLESLWGTLATVDRADAAFEAGRLLATMHLVDVGTHFGRMEERRFASWKEYVTHYAEDNLAFGRKLGIINQATEMLTREIVNSAEWLNSITQPQFIHYDYHFGNIHYHAGKINGIYDFEWSLAGDRALDLRDVQWMEDYNVGSKQPFINGYSSVLSFPDKLSERATLYNLLYKLELLPVSYLHWSKARFNQQVANFNTALASYD